MKRIKNREIKNALLTLGIREAEQFDGRCAVCAEISPDTVLKKKEKRPVAVRARRVAALLCCVLLLVVAAVAVAAEPPGRGQKKTGVYDEYHLETLPAGLSVLDCYDAPRAIVTLFTDGVCEIRLEQYEETRRESRTALQGTCMQSPVRARSVYTRIEQGDKLLSWRENGYLFTLRAPHDVEDAVLLEIVDGLRTD